ncbi:MAG TPA: hypothetical protein VHU23_16290 [Rhizomicrobium sp.]|jgi:hypothetical protein|nr:hypothetical protein [Rhizomicrobium sp.]
MSASPRRGVFDLCRVYRDAHARYARAFAKGDVNAIEDAFSQMQEIAHAFRDGAQWAQNQSTKRKISAHEQTSA